MWFENQFPYFMWMVLCGAGIMFFYDFLRIGRRIAHRPDFLINLEDIVFSALSGVAVFYVTYLKNNGELRWQTVFGLLIGGSLYFLIVRNRFVRLGCAISRAVFKIILKIVKIIIFPVMVAVKIILKPARIIFWYSGKGIRCIKTRLEIPLKNIKHIIKRK